MTPLVSLTYTQAFALAAKEKNILCRNHASAIAIVKFFPSAVHEKAHKKNMGYLNHYHLSSAHKSHIWYYGE